LDWLNGQPHVSSTALVGSARAVLALIARASIDLLTGPDRMRLGVCGAPGCALFFLKRAAEISGAPPRAAIEPASHDTIVATASPTEGGVHRGHPGSS